MRAWVVALLLTVDPSTPASPQRRSNLHEMKTQIKKRLEHLATRLGPSKFEQIQVGLLPPKKGGFTCLTRAVFGTPDLAKSICRRSLNRDGTVCTLVELRDSNGQVSGRDGLSDEALYRWIASHPMELADR